jgi:peptide/nickel transport system permease protein
LITVVVALFIGTTVGLVAGYYGHLVDDLLMRAVDIVLSIPSIFLFILVSILFFKQGSFVTLALTLASVAWAGTARLVRAQVLSIKEQDYIIAARSIGATDSRIILRHILPNSLSVIVVAASLAVPGIILAEAALDYLGFGIHPPTPSWGNMLADAQVYFAHSLWLLVLPGLMIFIVVEAFILIGNGVRDALDPRLDMSRR